ncbi:tryptophan-associated transmembrane protein [Streptomyces phage Alderaan]|nr:tryptophan-associated transmembrane protein [Streptomyces phage Alderaan]
MTLANVATLAAAVALLAAGAYLIRWTLRGEQGRAHHTRYRSRPKDQRR